MKKLLILLLFLFPGIASSDAILDPSQTYNTGNIVQPTTTTSGSTWTNAVYQESLTCWGAGQPGYCGPNPIVGPGNNINFSYGSTYIYQELPTLGLFPSVTGLQVRGYDFSFTAKNGNGWDDGRVDQLSALVRFWDTTTGKGADNLIYGNSWNLSYKYDWTNFTFSETFASPYDATTIGRVQYGFIGMDNNFWAGPYGPEITNISFNIKFGVDPCANDPLYSPSCPGYLDALQRLIPDTTAVAVEPTVTTSVTTLVPEMQPQTTEKSSVTEEVKTSTVEETESKKSSVSLSSVLSMINKNQEKENNIANQAVQGALAEAAAATQRTEQQALDTASAAVEMSTSSATSTSAQTENKTENNRKDNKETTGSNTVSTENTRINSMNLNLPGISNNVSIEEINIVTDNKNNNYIPPKENTSVEIKNDQGMLPLQSPITQQIESLTNTAPNVNTYTPPEVAPIDIKIDQPEIKIVQSPASMVSIDTNSSNEQTQNNTYKPYIATEDNSIANMSTASLGQGLRVNPITIENTSIVSTAEYNVQIPEYKLPKIDNRTEEQEEKREQTNLMDRNNVLNQMLENNPVTQDTTPVTQKEVVNTNVQPNELAGNTGVERLGIGPENFAAYTNFTLKDANFYEPKEVYKNQVVIDNRRALRQLASDRLHKEMVEMQYKGENK